MKNNFADALSKLSKKETGNTLQEVQKRRYETTKQISVYLDMDAIEFMQKKKLNRTQIINDAVIKDLKVNHGYETK